MIHVKYTDGTLSEVSGRDLQRLINEKQIQGFLRSSGWVDIERDPIRQSGTSAQLKTGKIPLEHLRVQPF